MYPNHTRIIGTLLVLAVVLLTTSWARTLPEPDVGALHTCLRNSGIPDHQFVARIDATVKNNDTYTYDDLNWQWNKLYGEIKPLAYVVAETVADVSAAVRCAVWSQIRVVAKAGGHSYLKHGFGDADSLIVDLHRMNTVQVNRVAMEAIVGPGTLNAKLQYELYAAGGLLFPTGLCPTVGVAGFTLGGGYSFFSRLHGMGSDNLLEAEMVDWTGAVWTANSQRNADLFWALRGGGGGNFGIVTSLKLRIYSAPSQFSSVVVSYDWEDFPHFFRAWQSFFLSDLHPADYLIPIMVVHKEGVFMDLYNLGGENGGGREELETIVATRFPTPRSMQFEVSTQAEYLMRKAQGYSDEPLTDPEQLLNLTRHNGIGWKKVKSMYVNRVLETEEEIARLQELYGAYLGVDDAVVEVIVEPYGGAINALSQFDTAFSHRSNVMYEMQLTVFARDGHPAPNAAEAMNTFFEETKPLFGHTESYQNYLDGDMPDWLQRYHGPNLVRLLAVKRVMDPYNVFRHSRSIPVPAS